MKPYYENKFGQIYHGDCLEILPELQKVDLVLTDPPYGMNLDTDWSSAVSRLDFAKDKGILGGKKYDKVTNDDKDYDPNPIMNVINCKEQFWFGADYYAERIPNKNKGSWLVWDKRLTESADKMYGSSFELIWSKTKHKRNIIRVKWAGVFGTEQQDLRYRLHPNQKPLDLYYWILEKYSNEGDIVFDGYLGSGTTALACCKLKRNFIGIEIEEKYCEIAAKRLEQYKTGLTPAEQDAEVGTLFDE